MRRLKVNKKGDRLIKTQSPEEYYVFLFGRTNLAESLVMSYFGVSDAKKYGTSSGISKVTSTVTSTANKVKKLLAFKK